MQRKQIFHTTQDSKSLANFFTKSIYVIQPKIYGQQIRVFFATSIVIFFK